MSKCFAIRSLRYVRRSHLCQIADNAERWDYNRQLDSKSIRTLPKNRKIVYPVVKTLMHEHRHGQPCELHMRLVVEMSDGIAFADVPLNYFDGLPKAYLVSKNDQMVLAILLKEDGTLWEVRSDARPTDRDQAIAYFLQHCDDPKVKESLQDGAAA